MTTNQAGTVAQPMPNTPAVIPTTPGAIAKQHQRQLIVILEEDYNYDIVSEIIQHIRELKRAKKIKPLDKHRMVLNYNTILLSYCMPKMRVTEDNSGDTGGKGVIFNIQIGGPDTPADPRKAGSGSIKKDKISTKVHKNKHVLLTVKTGPGDDYIEFELALNKDQTQWLVVSEYTDY